MLLNTYDFICIVAILPPIPKFNPNNVYDVFQSFLFFLLVNNLAFIKYFASDIIWRILVTKPTENLVRVYSDVLIKVAYYAPERSITDLSTTVVLNDLIKIHLDPCCCD